MHSWTKLAFFYPLQTKNLRYRKVLTGNQEFVLNFLKAQTLRNWNSLEYSNSTKYLDPVLRHLGIASKEHRGVATAQTVNEVVFHFVFY